MTGHARGMKAPLLALLFATAGAAAPPARFTAPQQPWASPDGQVRLLRPATAQPTFSQGGVGTLTSQGWRLIWDGQPDVAGRMAVRLALPVVPTRGPGQMTEYLQVGFSPSPQARHSCLSFGLKGGSGGRLPDRVINGVRFTVWGNGDAGMSQNIAATDYRAVVGGRCYAVERFSYGVTAADRDPALTLAQARGAAMLDAALASLHLRPGPPLAPPATHRPAGTVAR